MLIPYLLVSLANDDGIIPIDDVIVGPTPHSETATESIQRCVAQHLQRKHGAWTTQYREIPVPCVVRCLLRFLCFEGALARRTAA